MRHETQIKRRDSVVMQFRSLFTSAAHTGMTHADMLKSKSAITSGLKGAPNTIHAFCDGVWQQLQHDAYARELVHGFMWDGKFYSTHSKRDDYYGKFMLPSEAMDRMKNESGHYWANTYRGIRPFFTGKRE